MDKASEDTSMTIFLHYFFDYSFNIIHHCTGTLSTSNDRFTERVMGNATSSNRSQVWFLASPYSGSATAVKIMQRERYPTPKIIVPGYGLRRSNTKAQTFHANIQNSVRLQNSCSCRTFRESVKKILWVLWFAHKTMWQDWNDETSFNLSEDKSKV